MKEEIFEPSSESNTYKKSPNGSIIFYDFTVKVHIAKLKKGTWYLIKFVIEGKKIVFGSELGAQLHVGHERDSRANAAETYVRYVRLVQVLHVGVDRRMLNL